MNLRYVFNFFSKTFRVSLSSILCEFIQYLLIYVYCICPILSNNGMFGQSKVNSLITFFLGIVDGDQRNTSSRTLQALKKKVTLSTETSRIDDPAT